MKVKKQTVMFLIISGLSVGISNVYAQESDSLRLTRLEEKISKLEVLNGFKISGYFQGQFQYGQSHASLKVGAPNSDLTKDFNQRF